MENRLVWVDYAKAIGIALVVYAHIPDALLKNEIFLFHMPFEFILSGFLYKPRRIKDESIRCIKSLILPYLIYNGILLIITPPSYRSINQ